MSYRVRLYKSQDDLRRAAPFASLGPFSHVYVERECVNGACENRRLMVTVLWWEDRPEERTGTWVVSDDPALIRPVGIQKEEAVYAFDIVKEG